MKYKTILTGVLQTNCYLFYSEREDPAGFRPAFLVDPGSDTEKITERLQREKLRPEMILLTHGHFDHIGAAEEIREKFGCLILAGEEERDLLWDPRKNLSEVFFAGSIRLRSDRELKEGEEVEFPAEAPEIRIRVLHTPGHTGGGLSFVVAEEKLVLTGDTLFCGSYGRTDFPTGDGRALFASIREKLLTLPEDYTVLPGHGFPSRIGREKAGFPGA